MFVAITRSSRRVFTLFTLVAVVTGGIVAAAAHPAGASTCTDPGCLFVNTDAYVTTINQTLTVAAPGVMSNDLTPAGSEVDVANSDSTSAFGATVTLHPNGSFTYTPDGADPWTGLDSFSYTVVDPDENTDFNTVYVRVDAIARDDTFYTHVSTPLSVDAPGVFANDVGLEETILGYDGVTAHGQVVMNDDGSFDYTPVNGFAGMDSFKYTAWNLNEDNFFSATVRVFVDSTAPAASTTQPSGIVTLDTHLPVAWSATDPSGINHYDVQVRGALYNGGFGSYSSFKTATTTTSATYNSNGTGRTYCFHTRAVDNALNIGGYSAAKCTAIPIKSNGLSYSSGFKSASSSSYYGGIAYGTTGLGQTMTRTGVQAKKIYLVVSTCSTCGTLQVKWGTTVVANVSLVSSTTKHKVVVGVASFASAQTGTLTATVTSSGKGVVIEGLAAYRDA